MTSFAIPARTVSKGKQSTGCDGEVAAYLLSIWAENMQMQEGDISSELLFQFASIDLGEFEMVLDFVDSFQDISLLEAATILWTQVCRTLEKLQKEDMELAQQRSYRNLSIDAFSSMPFSTTELNVASKFTQILA